MTEYNKHFAILGAIATFAVSSVANGVVVFEDQFNAADTASANGQYTVDGTAIIAQRNLYMSGTTVLSPGTHADIPWLKSRISQFSVTSAEVADGLLHVNTKSTPFGGVVTSEIPEANFFQNEITISFNGITISADMPLNEDGTRIPRLEKDANGDIFQLQDEAGNLLFEEPNISAQAVKFGVAAHITNKESKNTWWGNSNIGASVHGSKYFARHSVNRFSRTNVPSGLKVISNPVVPYDISTLEVAELRLDDEFYQITFYFADGNVSSKGRHHLKHQQWSTDNALRDLAIGRDAAAASGDTATETELQAQIDELWTAEVAERAGYSAIFFGGLSADHHGVTLTVDSITIDTTTGLKEICNPTNPSLSKCE